MEFKNVSFKTEGKVGIITINHPPANALNKETITSIDLLLDEVEKMVDIKVLLLTGEGRFFIAGADIKEISEVENGVGGQELSLHGQKVFRRIETFPKPVIAVINGACLGGGLEIAMACHIRYVAEEAKLGLPELNLGLIPGFAGTQRLPRLVGKARAMEMLLASQIIGGKEAAEYGLANRAFPLDKLMDESMQLATTIASKSGLTLASSIAAINVSEELGVEEGGAFEADLFGKAFDTYDKKEGIAAFLEKRQPNFEDR